MLLCVDIGNSTIKFGVFDGDRLTDRFSISTKRSDTADDLAARISGRIAGGINAAIVCSVVPELDTAAAEYISKQLQVEPRFVRPTDNFGLTVNFPVDSFGADRLVNAFAASEKYGVPCIVASLGTATTIDVVDAKREYLGGLIAPGMKAMARALSLSASKLPEVEVQKPRSVIARTTETAIQSGIFYGQVAAFEGLLERVFRELGFRLNVIATGGFAALVAAETNAIDLVDPDLTFYGLLMIFKHAAHDRFDDLRPSA